MNNYDESTNNNSISFISSKSSKLQENIIVQNQVHNNDELKRM